MTQYRRNRVPGACYFFTVNLLDRRSRLLVDRADVLRAAVREAMIAAPFHLDAFVVLPEHLHCISAGGGLGFFWTMEDDQGGVFVSDAAGAIPLQ